jgi:hypothetical protein
MRWKLTSMFVIGTVIAASLTSLAAAQKPTVIRASNLVIRLNGGVSPTKLPKNRLAPVALRVSGSISTTDGSQPPVAKEITVDFDKHGTVNARGLASCRSGQLQARDTATAKRVCRKAIVGKGQTTVRVAFPDSTPFTATGPLVLFNGGVRGKVTTLLVHAYVNVPAPTAIVSTVKIKKIRKGRYGTRSTTRVPTIASGNGAVTDFAFVINRKFRFKGKRQSYLLAKCANRRFFAHAVTKFDDGTRLAGTVVRRCKVR